MRICSRNWTPPDMCLRGKTPVPAIRVRRSLSAGRQQNVAVSRKPPDAAGRGWTSAKAGSRRPRDKKTPDAAGHRGSPGKCRHGRRATGCRLIQNPPARVARCDVSRCKTYTDSNLGVLDCNFRFWHSLPETDPQPASLFFLFFCSVQDAEL